MLNIPDTLKERIKLRALLAWRILWIPVAVIGIILLVFAVYATHGAEAAADTFEDIVH